MTLIVNEYCTLDGDMGFEMTQAHERRVVPVAVEAQKGDRRLAKAGRKRGEGVGKPTGVDEVFPFREVERGNIGPELLLAHHTVVVVARAVSFGLPSLGKGTITVGGGGEPSKGVKEMNGAYHMPKNGLLSE